MTIERETIIERPATTETVVTGGNPLGIIGGVVAAALAVMLIIWLVNGGVTSNGETVNVDLPNVTVSN